MNEQRKSSHTIPAAVIGAIATVLAATIPVVIIINNQRDEPPSISTFAGEGQISSEPANAPEVRTAADPVTLGNELELDYLAAACFDGDWLACDELFEVSPSDSDYEWYGGTCGGILDEISGDTCDYLIDLAFYLSGLASSCELGDMDSCDVLYLDSPLDSDFEYFGATCGGRLDFLANGSCWELL